MGKRKIGPGFMRIADKPPSSPNLAKLIENNMKGVTSNICLRAEKSPGFWSAGQEALTFDKAYRQACGFAATTLGLGVGAGFRVGIWCANGIEYTLALIGCHLSGAAAVVREPDMYIAELMMVARSTKPHLVLLTPGLPATNDFAAQMAALPGDEARHVLPWWDDDAMSALKHGVNGVTATLLMSCGAPGGGGDFPGRGQVKGSPGESFVPPELPSDTVALICMTSGTTGTPKGAMHTTGGLAWMCMNCLDTMFYNQATLGPRRRGDCLPTVLTFQSGYISAYLVVAATFTLHLQLAFADTPELQRWLATQSWPPTAAPVVQMLLPAVLTRIWKTAAPKVMGKAAGRYLYGKLKEERASMTAGHSGSPMDKGEKLSFCARLGSKKVGKKVCAALGGQCRVIVTGGAKPDVDMLEFFWSCGLPIFEGFVSTEVLLAAVNHPADHWNGTAGPCPIGVELKLSEANEVRVRSPMGSIGYFDQPEITKDAFDEEGYFKTGDQGEWRTGSNGQQYLAITGRIKDMIILGKPDGQGLQAEENVWPETLEGIFKRSPMVADCVVPMSCEGHGHLILLVATNPPNATDAQLRAAITACGKAAGIQTFEFPHHFVRIREALTKENGYRNANHKLLRKRIDEQWRDEIAAAFAQDERISSQKRVAIDEAYAAEEARTSASGVEALAAAVEAAADPEHSG